MNEKFYMQNGPFTAKFHGTHFRKLVDTELGKESKRE